jgi:hypothetical protein
MRHFAPSPTSDARRWSAAAARGLRRALQMAAIRLCASRRLISLNDIRLMEFMLTALYPARQPP